MVSAKSKVESLDRKEGYEKCQIQGCKKLNMDGSLEAEKWLRDCGLGITTKR